MVLKKFISVFNQALLFDYFRPSRVAMDQMKSTDGFKLVKKQNVVDSIFAYYDYNELLDLNATYLDYFQHRIFDLNDEWFEPGNLPETASVLGENRILTHKLFNVLTDLNISLKEFYTPHLESQSQRASRLIDLIEQEYHLNGE